MIENFSFGVAENTRGRPGNSEGRKSLTFHDVTALHCFVGTARFEPATPLQSHSVFQTWKLTNNRTLSHLISCRFVNQFGVF